jgi:hypothetical protein
MKRIFHFSKFAFNHVLMSDIISVKAGATFIFILKKIKMIVGGKVSDSFIKSITSVVRQLRAIKTEQGVNGLIIYLKSCQIALQQAASGYYVPDMRAVGARVSRTHRSGYPRIIPSQHRHIMLNNLPGKYFYLRFYLTVFYVYRVIQIKQYVVKLATITDAGKSFDFDLFFPLKYGIRFITLFIKTESIRFDPVSYLNKYSKFFSILKASPLSVTDGNGDRLWSTHPFVLLRSALAIRQDKDISDIFEYLCGFFFPRLWRVLDQIYYASKAKLGKLSFKEEAAGKLRVFAIVDCFTQWLLRPLHKVIFLVLRRIPMDGTFDQLKPIKRLLKQGHKSFYSLDLTAATDRLPISVQSWLLNIWFNQIPAFGSLWARLLVIRDYYFTAPKGSDFSKVGPKGKVKYSAGQPMGAYSSWAMLALTHHFLVQVSAWSVGYPKHKLYSNYALLGDDLVIVDKHVADSYLRLMEAIGVKINLSKSILSHKGKGLEFAKRTFVDGQDVSPVSFRELSEALLPGNISSWVAFSRHYGLNFYQQAKILGYGYHTCKTSFRKMNHALKVLYLTNIAKIDFTSEVLQLQHKVPIDLNANVQAFKDTVLKPILVDLKVKLYGKFADLEHPQVLENIRGTNEEFIVRETIEVWSNSDSNSSLLSELFERGINTERLGGKYFSEKRLPTFVHPDDPGMDPKEYAKFVSSLGYEDPALTAKNLNSLMVYLHQQVVNDEVPVILERLRKAISSFDLRLIDTLDECLSAYLLISRLKAIQEIAALRLEGTVLTPSKKLPYQARLFRGWSRIAHKLATSTK